MSLPVLLLAHGAGAAEAVKIIEQGAAGRDSTGSQELGTLPGQPGADIMLTVDYPITGIADTAITLGSTGGRGGNGAYRTIRPNKPGSAGGAGGAVTLTLSGALSGGSDHTTATPLIHLYSVGGVGGYGRPTNNSPNRGGFGAGGAGGPVTMELTSSVNATGTSSPGIHLESEGGQAGGLPDDADRGTTLGGMKSDAGGGGGTVTLTIRESGGVTTTGADSPAVVASSTGGRGGSSTVSSVKYYGSNGGEGGAVTVTSGGLIQTAGEAASALVLQSVGGRGGDGGGGSLSASTAPGAAGGNGGTVTAQNTSAGRIGTAGDFGFGVLAQSVGGAGGKGGDGSWWVGGGDGGAAGAGGSVMIANSGSIQTSGAHASAIMGQSVGGGYALNAFRSSELMKSGGGGGAGGSAGWLSSGGAGGAGGVGGIVSITQDGTIATSGNAAYGVLAQSVGGGGAGGEASTKSVFVAFALGGSGGNGGNGGSVSFEGTGGEISTAGSEATAVVLQSVGGGGGSGGDASAGSLGLVFSVSVAVGGSGGKGGNGGAVTAANATDLFTSGDSAGALTARSVGGGGGDGGGANAVAIAASLNPDPTKPVPSIAVSTSIGGSGGSGGTGGKVQLQNEAEVLTLGTGGFGLQAQSVGGGGGAGGNALAYSLAVAMPGATSISVAVASGGSGGSGGGGGAVSLDNSGTVETQGQYAVALQAQSVGGGGGNGASASATSDSMTFVTKKAKGKSFNVGVSIGGSGGSGGDGGTVNVTQNGLITTRGTGSTGVVAQSIGGGGGSGGSVSASAAQGLSFDSVLDSVLQFFKLGTNFSLTTTIGGAGGKGGSGGEVAVSAGEKSVILTSGIDAEGIFAQSVGGGGGTAGSIEANSSGTFSLDLSMGRSGGSGGQVDITNAGTVVTSADGAHGLYAQSVGGGGGKGGGMSADSSSTSDTVAQLWAVLKKAVGQDNYDAWAAKTGNTETKEALDAFILAVQDKDTYPELSAAFAVSDFLNNLRALKGNLTDLYKYLAKRELPVPEVSLTLSMGGDGGDGGQGGAVSVSNTGTVVTKGDVAHALFAQSVGGGGGQGGAAYSSPSSQLDLGGQLGGDGGSGASGGTATITNTGTLATGGRSAFGLFGQSIGGGGGLGAAATSSAEVKFDATTLSLTVSLALGLGGSAGTGATGGAVTLANSGSVATSGSEAHGLVAQSVGGGGGVFLVNPATGKAAESDDPDAVPEHTLLALLKLAGIDDVSWIDIRNSDEAAALQSASLSLGGTDGASGNGGDLKITHDGAIATYGTGAFGILAQSVGGGGGFINAPGAQGEHNLVLTYGGADGASGTGGAISVTLGNNSSITTTGAHSTALFAQSVGGGGGYGGLSVLEGWTVPMIGTANGTSSGNGGDITIAMGSSTAKTQISTAGVGAHGVLAQSLGGGGGLASAPFASSPIQTGLDTLSTVLSELVSSQGASAKLGDNMDRIPAELRDYARLFGSSTDTLSSAATKLASLSTTRAGASGTGGAIAINLAGTIQTSGADAYAIYAQSGRQKLDGSLDTAVRGGNISITYSGTLSGGAGKGAAIGIDGGNQNTITIASGATVSALSGTAIRTSFGEDTLINNGTLIGDIDLSTTNTRENNSFTNNRTYRSAGTAGTITLGGRTSSDSRFVNHGTIDIAGTGTIGTLTVQNGSFTLGGRLMVDVASTASGTNSADLLVSRAAITMDALGIIPMVGDSLAASGVIVLRSDTIRGRKLVHVDSSSSSPISWEAHASNNVVSIVPSANFLAATRGRATSTEQNMLTALQGAWDHGGSGMEGTFATMANITSHAQYARTVDSLSASEAQGLPAAVQTFIAARTSLNAALSCPAFEGTTTLIRETQCLWANVTGNRMTYSQNGASEGFSQWGINYRMGGQWEFHPDWFLGLTAGYGNSSLNASDGLTSVSGNSGDVAIALKHQAGPWQLAGTLHAGYGRYDSNNTFVLGNSSWMADDTNDIWTGGLRLRAGYEFAFKDWYVMPYADLDVLHTRMSAYDFDGPGLSLRAGALSQWSLAFAPAVEFGARVAMGEKDWLRLFGAVGGTFLSEDGLDTQVWLSDGRGPGIRFTSSSSLPASMLDLSAGLQFLSDGKYEVRADYKAQIGDDFLNQEFGASLSMRF